jgi:hypothetical protein
LLSLFGIREEKNFLYQGGTAMRKLILSGFAFTSLLLLGLNGYSQDRPRDYDRYQGQDNDRFYRGRLFERVQTHLDRVEDKTFPFTGDRARLNRTKQKLNELQSKLDAGRYDEREANEVIESLQAVVNENRLRPRDRDVLSDDLSRMREFRERRAPSAVVPPGPGANAQPGYAQDRPPGDFDRDRANERFYRGRLFERVRTDLDRAGDKAIPFTGDRGRVNRAKESLNDLQRKFDAGRFDERELSEVIDSVQWVVKDNLVMSARDRDVLSDDLARLREFREAHMRHEEQRDERREERER